jgi:hypothetical protein
VAGVPAGAGAGGTYYLRPFLTRLPDGQTAAWAVTPGTVNGTLPKTPTGVVDPAGDPKDWAVPIGAEGVIAVKVRFSVMAEGGVSWDDPQILFFPWNPLGYTSDRDAANTYDTGHWVIGTVRKDTASDAWRVGPLNSSNLVVLARGYGWHWAPI